MGRDMPTSRIVFTISISFAVIASSSVLRIVFLDCCQLLALTDSLLNPAYLAGSETASIGVTDPDKVI